MSKDKDSISNQQIANTIQTIALAVFQLLAQPFVLITRVLFRKELGERYYTELNAVLSLAIIGVVASVASTKAELVLFVLWALALGAATFEHFRIAVPQRYRDGVRWHSRCSGVPRTDILMPLMERIVLGGAVLITYQIRMEALSALLLISLGMSYLSDVATARQFWNKVLDAVDGQIEAEELGKAVEDRLAPAQSSGLNVCVPSYASTAARRKIAEALGRQMGIEPVPAQVAAGAPSMSEPAMAAGPA